MIKTTEITIDQDGRDKGKTYLLTEMPALRAARWGDKALNGMARSNVTIPPEVVGSGIIGVYYVGLKMLFASDFPIVEELTNEMMACVEFLPDGNPALKRPIIGQNSIASDIMEITTIYRLREEVIKLHTGFTIAEIISKLTSAMNPTDSSNTDSGSSGPSSPPA